MKALEIRLDKIEEKVDRIEDVQRQFQYTQLDIKQSLCQIKPLVEDYHASQIIKKKWGARAKYWTVMIAAIMAIIGAVDVIANKVGSGLKQEQPQERINNNP